jgi:phage FluMu protein Com
MITCACASCGKSLQVADEWAGRRVRCPACQTVFAVPAAVEDDVALVEAVPVDAGPRDTGRIDAGRIDVGRGTSHLAGRGPASP